MRARTPPRQPPGRRRYENARVILSRRSCECEVPSSENDEQTEIILAVELRAIMRESIGETKAKINCQKCAPSLNPCNPWPRISFKNKMRPGQPPDRIRPCVPALACHRWRRNDGLSLTALEAIRVPLSPKPVADTSPCGHVPTTAAGPATLSCSEEQFGGGGRNARATSRACARSLDFPRQFTLENHRLPLALPQSFGKLRNFHVSLQTLSARSLRPATEKSAVVVQKLWRIEHPCGRQRKTKN